jgi:hypothetical protein
VASSSEQTTKVGTEVALTTALATEVWAVAEWAGAVRVAPAVMGMDGGVEVGRGPAASSGARFLLLWIE